MRVFIFQAYHPAGGTYMAYHLGRILHVYFGLEVIAIGASPSFEMFHYEYIFEVCSEETFLQRISADDLLVCNPSFSDRLFGLRLNCKKLCYIQGVRTFSVLDVYYDHYAFVSKFASNFVEQSYGIKAHVINAFINTDIFYNTKDYSARRTSFVISERKHNSAVFGKLLETYNQRYPEGPVFDFDVLPIVSQSDLAARFRGAKYYLSLDVMEGFGLPMLEAMACGCAVAGWDSGGCREYAQHGDNCLLAQYGDFDELADYIQYLITHPVESELLGMSGGITATGFSKDSFDIVWIKELQAFLKIDPVNLFSAGA